ncbi:hypothetical protein OSB04_008494 [Centaurea solstitialis]|uniref:Uncharacterized protein n=1 Tax=Centaurea solstitialis TaxID=347529 RepID=A0AA38TNM4_9ASTR|nr:hypothetical protein OSB04_008494 [Centaurea solstitialis]
MRPVPRGMVLVWLRMDWYGVGKVLYAYASSPISALSPPTSAPLVMIPGPEHVQPVQPHKASKPKRVFVFAWSRNQLAINEINDYKHLGEILSLCENSFEHMIN